MIHIAVYNPEKELLEEITAGIEEEGCLYEIAYNEDKDVFDLGWNAAHNSLLGAGIAVKGYHALFQCVHMKKNTPVFLINTKEKKEFRLLGSNAARYVKKIPFKAR